MNTEKWLEDLAARARADAPPKMDVVDAVTARLAHARPEDLDAMAVVAGSSAAAAAIVLAYALHTWATLQDPFSTMMASMNMVLR